MPSLQHSAHPQALRAPKNTDDGTAVEMELQQHSGMSCGFSIVLCQFHTEWNKLDTAGTQNDKMQLSDKLGGLQSLFLPRMRTGRGVLVGNSSSRNWFFPCSKSSVTLGPAGDTGCSHPGGVVHAQGAGNGWSWSSQRGQHSLQQGGSSSRHLLWAFLGIFSCCSGCVCSPGGVPAIPGGGDRVGMGLDDPGVVFQPE